MKTCLPAVLLSCALAAFVSLDVRGADDGADTIRKTFAASSGGTLVVEADRGSVTVEGGDGAEVVVEVTRKAKRGSDSEIAELVARHEVKFSQDGSTIRVESDVKGRDNWNLRGPQLEIDIRVNVPREFNVQATTAGGAVRGLHLKGDVALRTAGGSVHLEDVQGKIQAHTSGGSVKGVKLAGSVVLGTAGGGVTVEGVTGDGLRASTSGGSIRITDAAVPVEARTSGGGIDVWTSATPINLNTSGGSVHATLTAVPKETVELRTSAGSVTLTLPEDSAFNLDAATSAGSVRSDFGVTSHESGNKNKTSLRGPVNGGGPLIRLRSSAGGVRVKKG